MANAYQCDICQVFVSGESSSPTHPDFQGFEICDTCDTVANDIRLIVRKNYKDFLAEKEKQFGRTVLDINFLSDLIIDYYEYAKDEFILRFGTICEKKVLDLIEWREDVRQHPKENS